MGSVLGIAARLRKLRAMSAGEVFARVRYNAVLTIERQRHRRPRLAPADRLRRALHRDLRGGDWRARLLAVRAQTTGRFFSSVYERDAMRSLFATRFQEELADTHRHAADARAHRFEFFGGEFRYERDIDWQRDPVSGKQWPARFHADVPVHGGDLGFGDVKHIWELSRQQYLIDLAKAVFLSDSDTDLEAMQRLVASWMAGNPYGTGVNWSCALEPAFRAWSWLWAYHLTRDRLDPAFHLQWLAGFYEHGRFIARHLEHYSSPYNHLIGEAAALYAIGCAFPEFADAAAWRRLGQSVLEHRLAEQFYPDGGTVEQSTFYHHATLGFYLLATLVARANGDTVTPAVAAAIDRALTFSTVLMQPDGRTPEIGGADDGKPIRMEHLPFWDFRPYQAIGAVLTGRGDLKSAAGRFFEDALWLTGAEGLRTFDALAAETTGPTEVLLASSGYAVSRSDWSAQADYVCFDVGEQAAGMRPDAVPNSMHGHADCLSVIVSLNGRRVLVDSGLFAYNCGGDWEAHFRETAAHSTARIDGRDQARHIGKMAWSHSYRVALEGGGAADGQGWTVGSHDGYARGPAGVTHRRAIWRRPGGYVLVYDEFVGSGSHDVEVNYQFAPGRLDQEDGDSAIFDDFARLAWTSNGSWTPATRCGGAAPGDGWICASLGVRVAAPRLTLTARMDTPRLCLLTMIADRARVPNALAVVREHAGGDALVAVEAAGAIDWIAASGIAQSAAMSTDAPLAVCRILRDGRHVEQHRAGGTYLHVDPQTLARLAAALGGSHAA